MPNVRSMFPAWSLLVKSKISLMPRPPFETHRLSACRLEVLNQISVQTSAQYGPPQSTLLVACLLACLLIGLIKVSAAVEFRGGFAHTVRDVCPWPDSLLHATLCCDHLHIGQLPRARLTNRRGTVAYREPRAVEFALQAI